MAPVLAPVLAQGQGLGSVTVVGVDGCDRVAVSGATPLRGCCGILFGSILLKRIRVFFHRVVLRLGGGIVVVAAWRFIADDACRDVVLGQPRTPDKDV